MKKLLLTLLMSSTVHATASDIEIVQRSSNALANTADCIEQIDRRDNRMHIQLRSGKNLEFRRDILGRVTMIKIGADSYYAEYDPNFPQRLRGMKSSSNSHAVAADSTMPLDFEALEQSTRGIGRSGLQRCASSDDKPPKGEIKKDLHDATDGLLWPEDGVGSMFGLGFWGEVHRPYFEDAYSGWLEYSPRQNCIDRANSCIDVCDDAATKRSYSCAVLAAVYFEVPVAAAAAGLFCIMASDNEKARCKTICPPLSRCFG